MSEPYVIHHGDCLDVLPTLPDCSVDVVVTDPPYGLAEHKRATIEKALLAWLTGDRDHVPNGRGFMGRDWDAFVPPPAVWDECFRVLKPGGHLLAFAGSRTFDLMAISIRLAGLTSNVSPEIRDSIAWLYGSGFPKSLDVSKAIDKAAGVEREVISEGAPVKRMIPGADQNATGSWIKDNGREYVPTETAAATDDARTWQGWGTALKPAFEPIVVARKPLVGTVVANVLSHGTGALNIDGCRIEGATGDGNWTHRDVAKSSSFIAQQADVSPTEQHPAGRWPANVCLDEDQAAALDQMSGERGGGFGRAGGNVEHAAFGGGMKNRGDEFGYGDTGGASRFYFTAKATSAERPRVNGIAHPTVKPLSLMRWLVRLVTPPGGTVLEPFAGSGTTVEACQLEGFRCIAIEREADYLPLIHDRLRQGVLNFDEEPA